MSPHSVDEHRSTLFDLRKTGPNGLCNSANRNLATYHPDYLTRFGSIGSPFWWAQYDAERLGRTFIVGQVVFIGERSLGGEVEDVISILTEHRTIEYDREGFWLSEHVRVGVWITIEQIKAVCITPTGPLTCRSTVGGASSRSLAACPEAFTVMLLSRIAPSDTLTDMRTNPQNISSAA